MATGEELMKKYDELVKRVENASLRKEFDSLGKSLRAGFAELEARESAAEGETTSMAPVDLAKSFRNVIETIHAEARDAEEVGVTIRSMDIEIKGLVEATEKDTTLVLPSARAPIDPSALSTLRVSFSAVPTVREPPPEPPR